MTTDLIVQLKVADLHNLAAVDFQTLDHTDHHRGMDHQMAGKSLMTDHQILNFAAGKSHRGWAEMTSMKYKHCSKAYLKDINIL